MARALSVPPGPQASATGLGSLNDRLRKALRSAPVAGMKRVDLTPYATDRGLNAYEAALAPPLEILAETFGLIYTRRTLAVADSVTYVYERSVVLGHETCKAYRITEHPLRPVATAPPAQASTLGSNAAGPGPVSLPRPLPDATPQVESAVTVPCDDPKMQAVVPGSLTSPVPRQPP